MQALYKIFKNAVEFEQLLLTLRFLRYLYFYIYIYLSETFFSI